MSEQRVVFNNLTWNGYLSFFAAIGNHRSTRFTYDRGRLEITRPSEAHEFASEMIARFIRMLVEEWDLNIKTMGSTTLNYPELERGAEPDKGFYIQNASVVAGREVNLSTDPPLDLVVEVDITNTHIDKLRLYAAMGIPDFWRFDGEILRIYTLKDATYQEVASSATFPQVKKEKLYDFLADSKENEMQATRQLRQYLRGLKEN